MGRGQGGLYCPTTEFLILARCGKMPEYDRIDSTWWQVKRQMKHSKKPDFFQDMIETVSSTPRLEMFARREKKVGMFTAIRLTIVFLFMITYHYFLNPISNRLKCSNNKKD